MVSSFFVFVFYAQLCKQYQKPITVQYSIPTVSWVPRLTLLDFTKQIGLTNKLLEGNLLVCRGLISVIVLGAVSQKGKKKKKTAFEGGPLYKKRKCYVCFIINSSANCLFFFLLFSFYKEIKSLNIGKMKNSFPYNLIWFVCFLVFPFCFCAFLWNVVYFYMPNIVTFLCANCVLWI